MIYTLKIREEASAEIIDAFKWYEGKKVVLGEDFLRELDKAFNVLNKQPELFQKRYKSFRCLRLSRFPFAVLYEMDGNVVVVYSVFHCSREPLSWRRK